MNALRRALELATSSTPSARTASAITFAILLVLAPISPAVSFGAASSTTSTPTTDSGDFEDGAATGRSAGAGLMGDTPTAERLTALSTNTNITRIDSFEDAVADNYGSGRLVTVNSTVTNDGSHSARMENHSNIYSTSGLPAYPQQGDSVVYHSYIETENATNRFWFGVQDENNFYYIDLDADEANENPSGEEEIQIAQKQAGSTTLQANTTIGNIPKDEWLEVNLNWTTDGWINASVHYESNGTKLGEVSWQDTTWSSGGIGYNQRISGETSFVDNIYLNNSGTKSEIDSFDDGEIYEYDQQYLDTDFSKPSATHGDIALAFNSSNTWESISSTSGLAAYPSSGGKEYKVDINYTSSTSPGAQIWFGTQSSGTGDVDRYYAYVDVDDNDLELYKRSGGTNTKLAENLSVNWGGHTSEPVAINIKWQGNGTIHASAVNKSSGVEFANITGSDTTWSGGGVGYQLSADKSFRVDNSRLVSSTTTTNVSGRVTDQNGEPCANCTVEIVGVNHSQLSGSAEEKREQAKDILEEASNPFPESWNPDLSITGSGGLAQSAGDDYVAVHRPEDWAVNGWASTIELNNPIIRAPAEEQIALSAWKPSGEGGSLTVENTVDADLHGATVKRNIVVERLDPHGDVVSVDVLSPNSAVKTGTPLNEKKHTYVTTSLSAGIYRIHPENSESTAYTILVGDEKQLRSTFQTNLENQAGELTQAAKDIKEQFNQGKLTRMTAETNASGYYSADIPSNTKTVGVSAYAVNGGALDGFTDPTPQDMRSWIKNNAYNGSVYFSLEPRTYNVPDSNADISVRKFSSPPYQLLDEWSSKWANFRDRLENMTRTGIGSIYSVPLDEWNQTQLENGAENLSRVIDSNNEELINAWEERSGQRWDTFMSELEESERTNRELRNDIRDMESVISELRNQMSSEQPDTVVDDPGDGAPSTVTFRQIYDGDFSKDDVVATWHAYDGSTKPIPEQYISVNKRAARGDEVVVSDFPIPEESTGGTVGVMVVSENGDLGRGRKSVKNPGFDGDVPSIGSIDVSTLRPGPDERVTLETRLETAGVSFDSVEVFDGTGSTVPASIENGKARFTPGSTETHFVRLTFTGAKGNEFVETLRVPVGESSRNYPESVAVKGGRLGVFALAGDEVDDAEVRISDAGSTLDITALVKPDQGTNEIHYYLEQAPPSSKQSITVNVVEGQEIETATNVQRHVGVYIHGRELADNSIVYRKGSGADQSRFPIPASSSTRGGERKTGENGGTVIHSYTSSNGAATFSVNNDPGRLEQIRYKIDVWVTNFDVPLVVMSIPAVPLGDVVITFDGAVGPVVDVASSVSTSVVDELVEHSSTTLGVVSSGDVGDVLVDAADASIGGAHDTISPVTGVPA